MLTKIELLPGQLDLNVIFYIKWIKNDILNLGFYIFGSNKIKFIAWKNVDWQIVILNTNYILKNK